MLQQAKQTVREYGSQQTTNSHIGDGVQFPLIILGASQFEMGRPVVGWVLIGAGILFKVLFNVLPMLIKK